MLERDVFAAAGGDGEIEMSFLKSFIAPGYNGPLYLADFSPFTVLEFRDWLRHTGLYDDANGQFKGEGYNGQAWNYAADASPGTDSNGDGHTLNGDFGTSFGSWDLKYFNWSLSDPINGDPRAIPGDPPGFDGLPSSGANFIANGFDAPRIANNNDPFWRLWHLFRAAVLRNYNRDFARWITTSPDSGSGVSFPVARWYSDQIPADYLFGSNPNASDPRLLTGASFVSTGDIRPYGGVGITTFNTVDNGVLRRTSVGAWPVASSLTPNWAVWEYHPAVGATNNASAYQADVALLKQYRPHVLAPYRWQDPDNYYFVENTPFIPMLVSLMKDFGDLPHLSSPGDPLGFSPPQPQGVTAQLNSAITTVQWSGMMWPPDAGTEWTVWPGFSHFEVHRGPNASFTPTAATLVGSTPAFSLNDLLSSPGTYCYALVAVSTRGARSPVGRAPCVNFAIPDGPPIVAIATPTGGQVFTATSPFLTLTGRALDTSGIQRITWANSLGGRGEIPSASDWRIAGIPLQKGQNIITVFVLDNQGQTSTSFVIVNLDRFVYYLAEGATGFFDLEIAVANPNTVTVPYNVTYLTETGNTVVQQYTIGPSSRTTLIVKQVPGLSSQAVSTVVESPSALPLVVERTMFWDSASKYGGHGETATSETSRQYFFAEGSQGFFDTYVLLANPNATQAHAVVTFLLQPSGTLTKTYLIERNARVTVFAGGIPELVGKSFGIAIAADAPIIAERAMYFGAARFWDGGHESAGVQGPAREWFHPEGSTGSFFDTYILVANPNPVTANVTFTFLLAGGTTFSVNKQVAANGRLTFELESDPRLANVTEVSTRVTADVPVVSERAMYWPGGFTTWGEAHNSFGLTSTALRWGLAEGRVGTPQAFDTYILVANPSATAANVRVTFLRSNGQTVVKTYSVPATSRFTVGVSGMVSELSNENFGAIVESTNGVPIAVERAMYWNALGIVWAGGTNAGATPLP